MSEETVESMEETVMEDTPTEAAAPKAEKKSQAEQATHAVAKAAKDAPMLEALLPVGMEMELSKVPMVVTKVDGMTVTLKRTDIVG